jgi:hypothetical protein
VTLSLWSGSGCVYDTWCAADAEILEELLLRLMAVQHPGEWKQIAALFVSTAHRTSWTDVDDNAAESIYLRPNRHDKVSTDLYLSQAGIMAVKWCCSQEGFASVQNTKSFAIHLPADREEGHAWSQIVRYLEEVSFIWPVLFWWLVCWTVVIRSSIFIPTRPLAVAARVHDDHGTAFEQDFIHGISNLRRKRRFEGLRILVDWL